MNAMAVLQSFVTVLTALVLAVNAYFTAKLSSTISTLRAEMFEKFVSKNDCKEKRDDCPCNDA